MLSPATEGVAGVCTACGKVSFSTSVCFGPGHHSRGGRCDRVPLCAYDVEAGALGGKLELAQHARCSELSREVRTLAGQFKFASQRLELLARALKGLEESLATRSA